MLYFEWAGKKVLLPADVPGSIEAELIRDGEWSARLQDINLLKVSHHGSDAGTSPAWLDHLNPGIAVISVGKDNRWGRPHPDVMERLTAAKISVFRTDADGDIVCIIQREGSLRCSPE